MWGADDPDDRMPTVWEYLTYNNQVGEPKGRHRGAGAGTTLVLPALTGVVLIAE